jgi:23S rRNA pseudouridine955/2504/2580 synthase
MGAFREYSTGEDDDGRRLDRVLRRFLSGVPLSAIHRAIRKGELRVNGGRASPEYRIAAGDTLQIRTGFEEETKGIAPKESPPLPSILLETPDLIFIDKPLGVLVHDGQDSLEARVRDYLAPSLAPSLSFVPGPLHRLDRNTSGVVTFSKTLKGAQTFSEALRDGRVAKVYLALLSGRLEGPETWSDDLVRDERTKRTLIAAADQRETKTEGNPPRNAVTAVLPLVFGDGMSLTALCLDTGRTHQIRAQAASRAHPLIGDVKYGAKAAGLPYYLHAWYLEASKPCRPGIPELIVAPLPGHFKVILSEIFSLEEKEVYSLLRHYFL